MGLNEYAPIVHIHDETKDILEVFEAISERLMPWEVMFQQLVVYKSLHGDCNVPYYWTEDTQLGKWVITQRYRYKKGQLGAKHIRHLEEIGFVWDPIKDKWERMFTAIVQYKKEHGDCNVPSYWTGNPQLGQWVVTQRTVYKAGQLNANNIRLLDGIGFIWRPIKDYWERMFAAMVKYKKEHGDCNVPDRCIENPQLGAWVRNQRHKYKTGRLDAKRIKRLENIEFIWNPIKDYWEEMFTALVKYKQENGDCNVPRKYIENPQLGAWISNQRNKYKTGKLDIERIKRLEEIGFISDLITAFWEEMFTALVKYKEIYGNCNVPDKWSENLRLSKWVNNERHEYKIGQMTMERVRRLEKIGFVWDPLKDNWERMYVALVKYKEAHSNCNVPHKWDEDPPLSNWVQRQRGSYHSGQLDANRIKRLEEIGFTWNQREEPWDKMYSKLVQYKRKQGDCNVPASWPNNPQLGAWVNRQRRNYKTGQLDALRIRRLENIGFVWNQLMDSWEKMFKSLVQYKKTHGDCNVPAKWIENLELGTWVIIQRRTYKKGQMNALRIKRLESIGFNWSVRRRNSII